MDLHLKNHVVVVTGGASGIGLATALAFASEGARVAVWDLGPASTQEAELVPIVADVTSESAIDLAITQTVKVLGPIDHLVHANDGGNHHIPMDMLQREVQIVGRAELFQQQAGDLTTVLRR